jgi:hypothetical protein
MQANINLISLIKVGMGFHRKSIRKYMKAILEQVGNIKCILFCSIVFGFNNYSGFRVHVDRRSNWHFHFSLANALPLGRRHHPCRTAPRYFFIDSGK